MSTTIPAHILADGSREITILLFGPLATAAGQEKVILTQTAQDIACSDLRAALARQCPAIAPLLPSCRFAVNHAFASESTRLKGDEEIALIGLVCGG
jgi:molybdopterin converting factor small subunit